MDLVVRQDNTKTGHVALITAADNGSRSFRRIASYISVSTDRLSRLSKGFANNARDARWRPPGRGIPFG